MTKSDFNSTRARWVVGLVIILSIALSTLCMIPAFLGPAMEMVLRRVWRDIPVYDGMELRVSNGEVWKIYLDCDSDPLEPFFILVDGEAKHVQDLTPEDLESIGFEPGISTNTYVYGRPSPVFDMAVFSSGTIDSLSIELENLKFSRSPQGPFLSLPVTFDRFKEQFGKPKTYRAQGGDGRRAT